MTNSTRGWLKPAMAAAALIALLVIALSPALSDDTVSIGLNYPMTGPYAVQGLDQLRAATLAVEEVNAAGGISGSRVRLVVRDSQSRTDITESNVVDLIDNEQTTMVFGGSASSVALSASRICQEKGVLFFGTLTYSTATTGTHGHRHTFRECYDSWMGARALSRFLNNRFPSSEKTYFYITSDYTWGHTTEASLRHFTDTRDIKTHKGITTPFPGATETDFRKAIAFARMLRPDVLVLVLFGSDMSTAIRQATILGLKKTCQIVVPNLTLGMAENGGPKVMEGVVGAVPWCWKLPYDYDFPNGKRFVEAFERRYGRYPSSSGASAYTIVHQYKEAVERAGSFYAPDVIRSLEGHRYTSLKDEQVWRDFDHQSVQSVYAVMCKPEIQVLKDRYHLDYFDIIGMIPGNEAACTRKEWADIRKSSGRPPWLEPLPGDPVKTEER